MEYPPFTNVEKQLMQNEIKLYDSICIWCDLLGFGGNFTKANWNPSVEDWSHIILRLRQAYQCFMNHRTIESKSLMLNDGMVHLQTMVNPRMSDVGFLLKTFIDTHVEVNLKEEYSQYPGARTVLTFGKGCSYTFPEFRLDDFIINYTKADSTEISKDAKHFGNPIVAYNPTDFQMNTAFSKAYILDSLGRKHGLDGSSFFIDQSFFNFIEDLNKNTSFDNIRIETTIKEDSIDYFVYSDAPKCEFVYFGFEMSSPIKVLYHDWNTEVYKIYKYYPLDEPLKNAFDMKPPLRKLIDEQLNKSGYLDLSDYV